MANFNVDNLIINRAIRGTMFKTDGSIAFSMDEIKDPTLECTGEAADVTNALGTVVASFDRSKDAKLTGSNAFVHLGLAAAQFGTEKNIGSETNKLISPACDVLTVADGKVTLNKIPTSGSVDYVYTMANDGTILEPYSLVAAAPADKQFTLVDQVVTFADNTLDGNLVIVFYETETAKGVEIINSSTAFAEAGNFMLEVLFADYCNTEIEYHGFIVFPNAKMDNNVTINFNNEADHGFSVKAMQDNCAVNKALFKIIASE